MLGNFIVKEYCGCRKSNKPSNIAIYNCIHKMVCFDEGITYYTFECKCEKCGNDFSISLDHYSVPKQIKNKYKSIKPMIVN